MCGGRKDELGDEPAPRPVQPTPSQSHKDMRRTTLPAVAGRPSGAGPSGQYEPPEGPPPARQQDGFAPPSGPPPGRSTGDDYGPPSGPPPSQRRDEFAPPVGPPPGRNEQFAPPSGPPPGRQGDEYAPPTGPPPGRQHDEFAPPPGPPLTQRHDEYAPPPGPPPASAAWDAPPPGPPPSHRQADFAPPSGPPPSAGWDAPPSGPPPSQAQHDWEAAVPDTSLFPPPPAIFSGFDASPTSNASEEEAIAGEEWCEKYPLSQPMTLDHTARAALQASNIRLMEPTGFNGKLNWTAPGRWRGSTAKNTPDRCIISYPPLYVVKEHDPVSLGQPKTIYYEVKLHPTSRNVFLGMGFTALPYPSFRMPGWHRGSLAVHGDDGNKFINDRWGGKSFTQAFRTGETLGIGMTFTATGEPKPRVEIFFTRNGVKVGEWDLHEETDAEQDLPVTGLEGFHDLSCAIGTYDSVSFDVIFDPAGWMYKGVH